MESQSASLVNLSSSVSLPSSGWPPTVPTAANGSADEGVPHPKWEWAVERVRQRRDLCDQRARAHDDIAVFWLRWAAPLAWATAVLAALSALAVVANAGMPAIVLSVLAATAAATVAAFQPSDSAKLHRAAATAYERLARKLDDVEAVDLGDYKLYIPPEKIDSIRAEIASLEEELGSIELSHPPVSGFKQRKERWRLRTGSSDGIEYQTQSRLSLSQTMREIGFASLAAGLSPAGRCGYASLATGLAATGLSATGRLSRQQGSEKGRHVLRLLAPASQLSRLRPVANRPVASGAKPASHSSAARAREPAVASATCCRQACCERSEAGFNSSVARASCRVRDLLPIGQLRAVAKPVFHSSERAARCALRPAEPPSFGCSAALSKRRTGAVGSTRPCSRAFNQR